MNIYVNEQKIDATLDGETRLVQVVDQVSEWIESHGKILVNFRVDGREMVRSELESAGLEKAERLDFFVEEEMDVLESGLSDLDAYVDKIGSTLFGRDSLTEKESQDLKEGLPWIEDLVDCAKNILRLNLKTIKPMGEGKNVQEILGSLREGVQKLDSLQNIEAFLEDLRDFKIFLMDLSNRFAFFRMTDKDLKDRIQTFAENKEKVKKDFIAVNENFQSGKDHLASEILTDSIGSLNSVISSAVTLQHRHTDVPWSEVIIQGTSLPDFLAKLNECLVSIAQAMESSDIVYAGDILEYELPGLLDQFVPYLEEIQKRV